MSAPIITLFARSPAASRRTQALLSSLFALKPVFLGPVDEIFSPSDDLDSILPNAFGSRLCFDSTASTCSRSGAIVHILSLARSSSDISDLSTNAGSTGLELVSITVKPSEYFAEEDGGEQAVLYSRRLFSEHLRVKSSPVFAGWKVSLLHNLGRETTASDFTGKQHYAFVDLPGPTKISDEHSTVSREINSPLKGEEQSIGLREIVLPHFVDAEDDFTDIRLQSKLSSSGLTRPTDGTSGSPVVGLYQWPCCAPNSKPIFIRPLPAAKADFALSNPSLVFQCPSLENATSVIRSHGAVAAKVGFGSGKIGQLMVYHRDLDGLDIRFCESSRLSSSFDEAQQSLLAGSLDDLQSPDVLLEGGAGPHSARTIPYGLNGGGDCWAEFRANMKQPSGFLKKPTVTISGPKVAKAPDLPFE